MSLTYDSEHTRIQMTAPSGTTTYLNDPISGAMEEKPVADSTATWHDYIQADGHIVAEKFSGATNAVRYIVADHLGSTAIVTDETGAVVERDAYDAWGKRRNLDGSDDTTCSLTSQTTRGFTSHEHIDSECLINANARIYDPTIARFMSADSMVPNPFNGQAFNRFSYVNNGPLSATDPTGHVEDTNDWTYILPDGGTSGGGDDSPDDWSGDTEPITITPGPDITSVPNPCPDPCETVVVPGVRAPINIPVDLSFWSVSTGNTNGGNNDPVGSPGNPETVVVTGHRPPKPTPKYTIAGFNFSVTNNAGQKCIPANAGPVYYSGFSFSLVMGIGGTDTWSSWSIPSIGAHGKSFTGSFNTGWQGFLGANVSGVTDTFGHFAGDGASFNALSPVGYTWTFSPNSGELTGGSCDVGVGGGGSSAKTKTNIRSSNMPVCK